MFTIHHVEFPEVLCLVPSYTSCTRLPDDILRTHNISFHFYADDSQLYTTSTYGNDVDEDDAIRRIKTCIVDIMNWMTLNKLKLNSDKTELVIFHLKHRQPPRPSGFL